jgi:hypothetical protein
MKNALTVVGLSMLRLLIGGASLWGTLALYYSAQPNGVRVALAALFALAGLMALVLLGSKRWRRPAAGTFAALFASLLLWFSNLEPSHDRHWKAEVAVLPQVNFQGDTFTVRNIRNFAYRTETDFTPAYYEHTFDLKQLESVDVIASYWAGPHIAHIFLSFGFGPDEHLAMSIERRDEVGEGYSTIKGLFKQYELIYVVADERDLIRLRTNVRRDPPENVYLYTLDGPRENLTRLLLEYLRTINDLHEHPRFYNTLTTNCTSNIWLHAHVNTERPPYSWKILLSGHAPEYLHEQGKLDTSVPFAALQRASHINAAAQAAGDAADFSHRIRMRSPPAEAK